MVIVSRIATPKNTNKNNKKKIHMQPVQPVKDETAINIIGVLVNYPIISLNCAIKLFMASRFRRKHGRTGDTINVRGTIHFGVIAETLASFV